MRTLRKLLYIFFLLTLPLSAFGRKESYGNGMLLTGTEKNAGVSDAEPQFQIGDVAIHSEAVATVPIILHFINDLDVRGFQAKIILPEGLEYVKDTSGYAVLGDEYSSGYQITSNAIGTTLSILGFGTKSGNIFKEGIVCYFKVKAAPDFKGGKINVSEAFITFDNQEIACSTQSGEVVLDIPATSISLNLNQANLKVAETLQLEATVLPENATDKTVTWTSSDSNIIAINSNGLATAISVGEAIITATNSAGQTATITMTVIPTLAESLSVFPQSITLKVGESGNIAVTIAPNTTTNKAVSYSSANETIATVDNNGLITGVGLGETEVIISTMDGSSLSASVKVNIIPTPAESVSIEYNGSSSLHVGQTAQLSAIVLPEDATDKSVTWQVQNAEVLSVSPEGLLKAVGLGEAWVSATTSNGKAAYMTFNVIPTPVRSIVLNPDAVSLKANEIVKLTATVIPDDATNRTIIWASSNNGVAAVDGYGTVIAYSVGETIVTAVSTDGSNVVAECHITVVPTPVESITIEANGSTTLKALQMVQLTATITPETATDKSVLWSSSNSEIASVDENGLVTAKQVGMATISAKSGSKEVTLSITVIPTIAEAITLNRTTAALKVSGTIQLSASFTPETTTDKAVTWISSNEAIATVNSGGLVTAQALGECEITATTADGSNKSASCHITVGAAPAESVSIEYNGSSSLHVGQTAQLSAIVLPEDATDKSVTWQVQNAEVLSVSPEGLLKAVGLGEAWVSATTSNGKAAYMTFNVIPTPVRSIVLNPDAVSLKANEIVKLTATVIPDDATNRTIIWASSNNGVAAVDGYGTVIAYSVGETIVTAVSTDGSNVVAECHITVVPTPVESITIEANGSTTLKALQMVQLTATITPETATDKSVLWSSSNSEIASVDENGLVTAKQVGMATISAKSGSKEVTLSITVIPTIAEAITLNRTTAALKVSGTIQLSASFTPETTTDKAVTWISSNEAIATVNSGGLVTAQALGECEITATTADGSNKSASCHITVGAAPAESISIEPKGPFTLRIGETVQFSATVLPQDATDKSVSWKSQTGGVTIDANGLATAVASVENNWISATNSAGQQDLVYITVVPTLVSSIDVVPQEISLKVNQTIKVQAVVNPVDATDKSLKWSSSNTSVATVDGNGNIIAVAMGETDITVTANDGSGVSATCKVTVVPTPVESVSVTANGSTTLKPGQSLQLNATVLPENATDKTVVWTSSDVTVATVTNSGLVTAVSVGNASITATAGDRSASVGITVEPILAESLILFHTDIDLKVGEEYTLSPVITPENTTDKTLVWWSDDESIASVDSNGTVHANAIGNTVVRVSTTDGTELKAEARIYVHPTPISKIIIDYDGPTTLKVGETAKLSVKVLPENATDKNIKWLVMSPAILNISEDGLVTAVGTGTSWAGAFADNESEYPYDIVEFTVVETPVDRIDFEQESISIRIGEQTRINPIVYPETATNKSLIWESKDSNIAVVDNNGIVTGIAPGQVDINALAADGSGVFNTIRVIVSEISVESITISANGSTTLKDGETLQLTATVLPENATDKSVRWVSNADYRATVDENGLVTAHSDLGVLDIYAYAGNVSDKIMLTIIETPAENIALSSDVSEIKDKETISIYAQISPVTTSNKSVTWNVSDESILKIQDWDNSVCVLIGQKPGEAYVTATTVNGITQSYLVTVRPVYVQSITIPSEITVEKGSQYEFKPEITPDDASDKQLVWESSNPSLGSFYGNVFYAHARGEVIATCRAVDGSDVFAQCHIKIATYAKSLTLNEHDLSLEKDDTFQLVATIEPIDAVDSGPIVWESSNTNSVSVDKDGLIMALAEGESTIIARTQYYPWATDECLIKVSKNSGVETITIDEAKVLIDGRIITVDELSSGTNVRLIDLDGRVRTFTYSGQPIQITVEQSGIYILSLGKYSLKIAVR